MEKREYELLWNYYIGMSKTPIIWEKEINDLHITKKIKKIYEVIDKEYGETWYLLRTSNSKSYIVKTKCGNLYAIDLMDKYRQFYDFNTIDTDVIKIFAHGYFPVIFKVSYKDFCNYYNKNNNKNTAFFTNYYCFYNRKYIAVREIRNKVEAEFFSTEIDAIYWLSDFSKTKKDIEKNNIRPLNLMERVYEYKEKG